MTVLLLFNILLFYVPVHTQTWDIGLVCPGNFTRGSQVTLDCTLRRPNFPDKCTQSYNERLNFIVKSPAGAISIKCTVTPFTSCGPMSAVQLGCACVSNVTAYTFKYKFTVDGTDEGTWECSVPCSDAPLSPALTLHTEDCDDKTVTGPCESNPCQNSGTCQDNNNGTSSCICLPDYDGDKCENDSDYSRFYLILLLLLLLPIPIPLPWPGYPIYVVLCRISNQSSSTGSPRTDNWHPHYICGRRTNNVYFFAWVVTNDGRPVLIWSRSPTTGRFVLYGTEATPGTNSSNVSAGSGAVNNGNKQTSQKEKNKHTGTDGSNVSAASGAANNGNQETRQKEKNKHTGTDGSSRKSRQPEPSLELTTVRIPPQAATAHGDNQTSGTPHGDHQASGTPHGDHQASGTRHGDHQASGTPSGDHQASGTPHSRPLPEPSRMTSVERNSTAETSTMLGRDNHSKLPPIGKPDNNPKGPPTGKQN